MIRNARTQGIGGVKRSPSPRIRLIKYQIEIYGTKAKKYFKYEEKV